MSSLTDSQIEACSNVQDDGTIEIDAYFLMKMVEKDEQDKREKDLMSQLGFVSDDGKKDEKKDEKKKGLLLNESIMANTGLTKDETKILWEKTSSFSVALRKRYPDEFYMTKLDEISELIKRHQLLVIDSLKQQRGVGKTAEVAEIDKVVEEWIEEAAAGVAGQKDDEKKDEENLCPRCIEDHDDEHGERVSGSKVVSSCDDCGVCENCEHLMECKGLKEYQMLTEKNRLLMEENQLLMEEEKKKVAMGKKIIEKYEQFIEDHQEEMEKNQKEIEAMEENPLLGEYQLKMLAAKRKFAENYEQIIEHHQKTSKAFDEWMAERSKRDDGKKEEDDSEDDSVISLKGFVHRSDWFCNEEDTKFPTHERKQWYTFEFMKHLTEKYDENRIYLNVPYNDKDDVKVNGGRWDVDKKQWYTFNYNAYLVGKFT